MKNVRRTFLVIAVSLLTVVMFPFTVSAQESYATQVQKMYVAYYGRPGDPGGIEYWVGQLENSGGDLAAIIDSFGSSDEYNERFGALDDTNLVNNIYQQLFGRDADSEGLAFYVGRLESLAMTLGSIALNIADGVEDGSDDAAIVSNKLAVADAYTEAVSEGQFEYGSDQISDAQTLLSSVDGSSESLANALDTVASINTGNTNTAPTANAGVDQSIETGNLVLLDGSASSDVDNDPLSYVWSFVSLPTGSTSLLSQATSETPEFTPDIDGTYIVQLVVNDGELVSEVSTATITSSTTDTPTVGNYSIVDTNQSDCYSSTSGQVTTCIGVGHDGDYDGNQPDYTVDADGLTVTDNVTGLIWQQSSDVNNDGELNYADKLYQGEAVTYCENLTLAGRDDWRLPSVKEAYSLILFSGEDASSYQGSDTSTLVPFIDSKFDWAFGDITTNEGINAGDRIIDAQYASTSVYVSTTMNGDPTMFGVNFVDGRIKGYPIQIKEYYVRCVTGNTEYGTNDFVDNGDETITDRATGLMWQQNDSEPSNWDSAVSECEAATTASYTDWRLPNAKELQSIVDYTRSPDTDNDAAINMLFNSTSFLNEESVTDWGYYWTSTTHADNDGDGSNAVYVSFGRALGYMNGDILDVHGAGSQRSNDKLNVATEPGAQSATESNGLFYYKGPQGDILRANNKVRCVRTVI